MQTTSPPQAQQPCDTSDQSQRSQTLPVTFPPQHQQSQQQQVKAAAAHSNSSQCVATIVPNVTTTLAPQAAHQHQQYHNQHLHQSHNHQPNTNTATTTFPRYHSSQPQEQIADIKPTIGMFQSQPTFLVSSPPSCMYRQRESYTLQNDVTSSQSQHRMQRTSSNNSQGSR